MPAKDMGSHSVHSDSRRMAMRGQPGFFDVDERYAQLNAIIPWAAFEKPLAKALKRSDGSKGGHPPYPATCCSRS